jgi:hypothetical protein
MQTQNRRHRNRTTFARALAGLLALTMVSPLSAAPGDITRMPAPTLGADPPKAHDIPDGDMNVSTQTGAFHYTYPIAVPPGRLGVQPSLALTYSSQGANYGGIAAGWSLSIPEIKVDTSQSLIKGGLDGVPFGTPGANGHRGKDHYHQLNPNAGKGKANKYLDKTGKPVHDGSGPSHLYPGE